MKSCDSTCCSILASVPALGGQSNGSPYYGPEINADVRHVVFRSPARNRVITELLSSPTDAEMGLGEGNGRLRSSLGTPPEGFAPRSWHDSRE